MLNFPRLPLNRSLHARIPALSSETRTPMVSPPIRSLFGGSARSALEGTRRPLLEESDCRALQGSRHSSFVPLGDAMSIQLSLLRENRILWHFSSLWCRNKSANSSPNGAKSEILFQICTDLFINCRIYGYNIEDSAIFSK